MSANSYHVGILIVQLSLPESHSLKDKRRILKSLKDRIRNQFNVSIAEIGELEKWQYAALGVTTLSNDGQLTDSILQKVLNFVEKNVNGHILDSHFQML